MLVIASDDSNKRLEQHSLGKQNGSHIFGTKHSHLTTGNETLLRRLRRVAADLDMLLVELTWRLERLSIEE